MKKVYQFLLLYGLLTFCMGCDYASMRLGMDEEEKEVGEDKQEMKEESMPIHSQIINQKVRINSTMILLQKI